MPEDDFYQTFARATGTDRVISHGPRSGQISLKITPQHLLILVEGEPDGKELTACFRDAMAGKAKIEMPTLVDLTRFRGQVDWGAIRAVRDMAPWGKSLVAYVINPDSMFDMVLKILGVIFGNAQHRRFGNHAEALAWLDGR